VIDWLNRRDWLESLLSNQVFDFVLLPLIILALAGWLVADFMKTRRAVKRGDPLAVWYLRDPVYPGDPLYSYFALQREYPAMIMFAFVGLIVLLLVGGVIWVVFWPPHA